MAGAGPRRFCSAPSPTARWLQFPRATSRWEAATSTASQTKAVVQPTYHDFQPSCQKTYNRNYQKPYHLIGICPWLQGQGDSAARLPGPQSGCRSHPRHPAGGRQHPLHYAAAAGGTRGAPHARPWAQGRRHARIREPPVGTRITCSYRFERLYNNKVPVMTASSAAGSFVPGPASRYCGSRRAHALVLHIGDVAVPLPVMRHYGFTGTVVRQSRGGGSS